MAARPDGKARVGGRARAAVGVGFVLVCLLASAANVGAAPASSGPIAAAIVPSQPTPSAGGSLPCYNINATICVSMQNTTEPDIIPGPGSHVSSVEPAATQTLAMYVESVYNLVWLTAKGAGPFSPIGVNVTGTLWNGVPYWSAQSNSVWHPQSADWWSYGPTGANATYPYWYAINISARAPSGAPNFFPGMNVTWWLYITSNVSGVLHHLTSVPLQYTYAGAFPFSPYPGAHAYAGAAAALEDIAVTRSPLAPNFNDSVRINLTTTGADLATGASLGGAYLDLSELAPDGSVVASSTWEFPITVSGTQGQLFSTLDLPASLAQVPGALVEYTITAWDTNPYGPDTVTTPTFSYSVNGNGTFGAASFAQDLSIATDPGAASSSTTAPATVPEGQPIDVVVSSQNLSTSILAAEVDYTFTYGAIGEATTAQLPMSRINATAFDATIPGMPLNASVSYTVTAWDFDQDVQTSAHYVFATPSIAAAEATVPLNSTFFVAYVYDAGDHGWVTGAHVSVDSTAGYLKSESTTFLGVAYPNATGRPFVPLFLPASGAYRIIVNDSLFRPNGVVTSPSVSIVLAGAHTYTAETVLAVGSDYVVAQSGNAIYFWLNETGPGATYSPALGGIGSGTLLGATVGLIALAVIAVPLALWWQSIRARRQKEERRITL